MESERRESLAQADKEHHKEMKALEEKLGVKFDRDLAQVNETHLAEIEQFRHQIESVVTQSQKQVSTQSHCGYSTQYCVIELAIVLQRWEFFPPSLRCRHRSQ